MESAKVAARVDLLALGEVASPLQERDDVSCYALARRMLHVRVDVAVVEIREGLPDRLAAAGPKAPNAIRTARADAREYVWKLARNNAPDRDGHVIVDLDGVLVLAHSEKQAAAWKKNHGHHPLMCFVDHGRGGTGEPVAACPNCVTWVPEFAGSALTG